MYAPTLQAETVVKEAFYRDLHNPLQQVDSKDKLLILGDFNTRVGRDFELWKGVLCRHGIGNCNDSGRLLLEFCSEHQLIITNTLFQQKDRFNATWRHPLVKRPLKAVYGPSHQIQAPLRSSEGCTLLTDKEAILKRWSEHFEGLFSDQRTVQGSSLVKIPQVDVRLELGDPPTRKETRKATMQLKVGKSPGIDDIPAEVYQHGGEAVLDELQDLFTNCWEKGTLMQDLRDAVIISLYKNKGEKSDCSNYQGITLLSIAGKILARVLLNRLIPTIAQKNTPESQCGFRFNRGTVDMILVLRQIQEKRR